MLAVTRPSVPVQLRFGALTLIPGERVLLRDGVPVPLTPKAFDLLSLFAANAGRLLTKDEILRSVWPDAFVEESNLAYHVFSIRKAIGDGGETERFIETVPKQGYRFIAAVERSGPDPVPAVLRLPLQRFQEPPWGRPAEPAAFSVSPDGRYLAMAIQAADGAAKWWVRGLDEPHARPLAGTEGFIMPPPIWSADSRHLALANGGPLKYVAVSGGVPTNICDIPGVAVGGCWNGAGVILVGCSGGALLRCHQSGGPSTPVTVAREPVEVHLMPSFLSNERHFIYLRVCRRTPDKSGVYVGRLDNESGEDLRLIATGFQAQYVAASDAGSAAILFMRDGALMAQRFDDARLELRGVPVRLASRVGSYLDYAYFSASPRIVVCREPDPPYQLTWFDRGGREVERVGPPEPVAGLALSPSGTRALVARHSPHNVASQDLWLFDLGNGANPRRLTFTPSIEHWPVWLTDERFAYGSAGGERDIYEQTVGGNRRRWFAAGGASGVTTAHEGRIAVFVAGNPITRADLWVWTPQGPPEGRPLVVREADQTQPQVSPDGRWLAYVSNESGRSEVFVTSLEYDSAGDRVTAGDSAPVSRGGGFAPRWRGDGRELLYLQTDGSVMSVPVHDGDLPDTREARRLFAVPGVFPEWGITHDGERMLFGVPTAAAPPLQVIQNWQTLLPE